MKQLVEMLRAKKSGCSHPTANSKAGSQFLTVMFALMNRERVEFVYLHVRILNCTQTCPCCGGKQRSR